MAMSCDQIMVLKMNHLRLTRIINDWTPFRVKAIHSAYKEDRNFRLILIVFPKNYSTANLMCCVDLVATQVNLTGTIFRINNLKSISHEIVNRPTTCKLCGTLSTVKTHTMYETMIMGMDIYHDPTRQKPSVCVLVGSLNRDWSRWYAVRCRAYRQSPGTESNDELEVLVQKTLTKYKEANGFYPGQIILYRNGADDGDIRYFREHEISQILTAFNRISPDYKPKFLFVIAQQRIHTRFFETHGKSLENPSPGTVVDHTVTKKSLYDFYVVSPFIRQGTVTPRHYVVVHNATNLTPDQVQMLTFKMSIFYFKYWDTLRPPAPCRFAHKLAKLDGERNFSLMPDEELYFLILH